MIELHSLKTSVGVYLMDVGEYPTTAAGLVAAPDEVPPGKWGGPYVDGGVFPDDPWGNPYQYRRVEGGFLLWSMGPDEVDQTGDEFVIGP